MKRPTLRKLVDEHLEWMRVRQYAQDSVYGREASLRGFLTWFEERAITDATDVTRAMVERYQRWLFHFRKENGKPLSVRTQYVRLNAVRQFFRWALRVGHVETNPAADIEFPRLGVRLPRDVMSPREAELVLGQADITDPIGLRDRAVMEVMYSTGMRRKEVAQLKIHDIDVENETLFIKSGKGDRDRVVPIGERGMAWLQKYLDEARPKLACATDPGNVFLNATGDAFRNDSLTFIIRRYVEASGISKKGSCHLFRHTMATAMLEGGADIRFIQAMLGHVKLTTTEIYTRVSIGKLKEVHGATHPGAKLKPVERAASTENEPPPTVNELLAELDEEAAADVE